MLRAVESSTLAALAGGSVPTWLIDLHINDPAFAHALADTLLSSLR